MKKLNKSQGIAVCAALAMLTYLFFSGPLMNLFNANPITANNNNQMLQTGFTTQDLTIGTGEIAERGDILTVHYVGVLTDSRVFDSSRDSNTPFEFTLGVGQVIRGWDEGLRGMRVGGRRVITIAPDYGYGASTVGPIPANSTLIFEVELINVKKPARTTN